MFVVYSMQMGQLKTLEKYEEGEAGQTYTKLEGGGGANSSNLTSKHITKIDCKPSQCLPPPSSFYHAG